MPERKFFHIDLFCCNYLLLKKFKFQKKPITQQSSWFQCLNLPHACWNVYNVYSLRFYWWPSVNTWAVFFFHWLNSQPTATLYSLNKRKKTMWLHIHHANWYSTNYSMIQALLILSIIVFIIFFSTRTYRNKLCLVHILIRHISLKTMLTWLNKNNWLFFLFKVTDKQKFRYNVFELRDLCKLRCLEPCSYGYVDGWLWFVLARIMK